MLSVIATDYTPNLGRGNSWPPKPSPTYSGGNKSPTKTAKERARKKVARKSRQMQRKAAKR